MRVDIGLLDKRKVEKQLVIVFEPTWPEEPSVQPSIPVSDGSSEAP